MLQVRREAQITVLHSQTLDRIPGIVHAFSTRRGERPDFTMGPSSSANPMIQINRQSFLAALGIPGWPILKLKQVHSGTVVDMTDTWPAGDPVEGDAAITALRSVVIGVQTADCVPILVADREARCVAAIHAGWRGTAAGISKTTIEQMKDKYGAHASDLTAVIGPNIGVCCYEVGEDVAEALKDPAAVERRADWPKPHLDLGEANRRQLLAAGIEGENIVLSKLCTRCRSDLFFSYRREGISAGRLLSVIGIHE